MKKEIKVLDHGYVKYIDHMGSDQAVIEAARMSVNKGFQDWERDAELLEYLYANKHMTPFECGGELQIEVYAPIFVFRQWHRHRTQSFNEQSARYSKMPDVHYLPTSDRLTKQSKTNRQGSSEELLPIEVREGFLNAMKEQQDYIFEDYENFVKTHKVSKEIARLNCPVSRYSKMRAKTDLRNWLHFLGLRLHSHAQWEIRQYAQAVAEIIKELWPRTYELFEEHTLGSVTLSRSEVQELNVFIKNLSGLCTVKQCIEEYDELDSKILDRAINKLGIE